MRYHKVHNLVLMKTKLFHTKKTRNEKNNKRTSWKKLSNVNTIKYPRKWASFSLNKTGSNGVVRIWLRRKPEMEDCPKKKLRSKEKLKAFVISFEKRGHFFKAHSIFCPHQNSDMILKIWKHPQDSNSNPSQNNDKPVIRIYIITYVENQGCNQSFL